MFDDVLVAELESLEPGVALAALLASIDEVGVSGRVRVAVLRARRRQLSHLEAGLLSDMAAIVDAVSDLEDLPQDLVFAEAAAEVRSALALTRRAADVQVELALRLRHRLPQVAAALDAGAIDLRRARVIDDGTCHLDAERAREIADEVLDGAGRRTTGQLAATIRRLCIDVDPDDAADRYRRAVDERRLVVEPTVDGTSNLLGLDLPPDRVAAIRARINHIAKSLRRPGETRTMDQLRADVLLDLLEGNHDTKGGVVELRVDLETLAGLVDRSGELGGYGPIVAEIARRIAERYPNGDWRFAASLGDTIVDTGVVRRRPTSSQRRHVQAANTRCVFPGCRMPASDCDIDHTIPWAQGGPTTVGNTAPLCRHDHLLKDTIGWECRPDGDGAYRWTSPLGLTYTANGQSP